MVIPGQSYELPHILTGIFKWKQNQNQTQTHVYGSDITFTIHHKSLIYWGIYVLAHFNEVR